MSLKLTYLAINFFSVLFPFLLSFDKKVAYYKRWKELFKSIFIVGLFFIVWDIFFTKIGVWSFNPQYIIGIYFMGLPLEEILFFIFVPYASIFIYDCYKAYFKYRVNEKIGKKICIYSGVILLIFGFIHFDKHYTFYNSLFGSLLLLYHGLINKKYVLGAFFIPYLIHLIPFLIVNGFLTAIPVVIYNNLENLGIRIYTIPVEDTIYALTMMLGVITFYEKNATSDSSIL